MKKFNRQNKSLKLIISNKVIASQNCEKEKKAAELIIANKELEFQKKEKKNRAAELIIANIELAFQQEEKLKRAAELIIANNELEFQNKEKYARSAELVIANLLLAYENDEKEKRASELIMANVELALLNKQKEKSVRELIIANNAIRLQNEQKEKIAKKLNNANEELTIQFKEKEKRTAELLLANNELEFLFNTIPQVIWTSSADGIVNCCNNEWFNNASYTAENSIIYDWKTAIHPDDFENYNNNWKEAVKTGNHFEAEFRLKKLPDDIFKWYLGRASALKDKHGKIVKWFGSFTDINDFKKVLLLQNTINQFEDFNRIIAHNLRGPSGSIQMIIAMISESSSITEKRELFEMLKLSSKSLNSSLDQLIKVMEVRNNKNLSFDDCDLNDVVTHIKGMLKGQILSTNASIITNFKIRHVKFPLIYLESIFYNLISNSLKYCKSSISPKLVISSHAVHEQIILTFNDNGLGIDLNAYGRNIFKLNQVFHKGFESSGIGLYMTKTQIETFGGQISVNSQPNEGSTFIVTLQRQ